MSFLNALLLFGVAALSIPLIIHLLNRSRHKKIQWGAMHLLETVVRTNKKRVKLEQIILLIIRCAIPVILALCLARPVLTGWRSLAGDTPASMVLLLDNSYSMEAGDAAQSSFEKAVEESGRILSRLKRGSDAAVLTTGGSVSGVMDQPTFDTGLLSEKLRGEKAGMGRSETLAALEKSAELLSKRMTHAQRSIVLFSDFQKSDWTEIPPGSLQRVREVFDAMPVRPALTLFPVPPRNTDNLAIESLDLSRPIIGAGQMLGIRAHVVNHGQKSYSDLRVYFRVDGKQMAASQMALGAGERGQALFTHTFEKSGSHVVEVEIDAVDLKTDNLYTAAVHVLEKIPVLLVDGDPSPQALQSETDFLRIALQPFASAQATLADLIEARTIKSDEFRPEHLQNVRAAVLANVPRLKPEQLESLQTFVKNGGGLLLFLGNKVDVNAFNGTLASGPEALAPARIEALAGHPTDTTQQSGIVAQHFSHPALQLFNDRRHGDLSQGRLRLWYRLNAEASAAGTGPVQVLARLDNGDPLLLEKPHGQGAVILAATSGDADWSNLPMRPFFVPLMQELVVYLASGFDPPRNLETGKPLLAMLPVEQAGTTWHLVDPAGRRHPLKAEARGSRATISFADTRRPGLYTLYGPQEQTLHFVAQTHRGESRLDPLNETELQAVAKELGAQIVRDGQAYAELEKNRRHGREIWPWFWWAVLALLFSELYLQQRFARGAD